MVTWLRGGCGIVGLGVLLAFSSMTSHAQAPKKADPKADEKKADPKAMPANPANPPANTATTNDNNLEELAFKTADGVKIVGKLYKSPKGAQPVVLMLHDYKADPNEVVWNDTAKLLASKDYNVLRFDFRGHGKSTDVIPGEFWIRPENRNLVSLGGKNPAVKSSISYKEFRQNYFPMLVQDIAAARHQIDVLNDNGIVNASTIYLLGVGDAASLGMLYLASEWSRERQKPNTAVVPNFVSPNRYLFPNIDPAGMDFGGAIWLSPTRNPSISNQNLKDWALSPRTVNLRTETAMLFVHGEKDTKSAAVAKYLYKDVLMVEARTNPISGQKLIRPEQTFIRDIKGSNATGTALLGHQLGTEEMIEKFLKAVDNERRSRTRKTREWDKPLIVEVQQFGVCR